jgi:hypothetical protein
MQAVMIGEGESLVPQLPRPQHQFLDVRSALEEREVRVAVEFGVVSLYNGQEVPTRGSSGSSWKGRAIEWLLAAQCILASNGRLNVSTAMVDDEGVDLVFNIKGTPKTLAVQVKSRFASAQSIQKRGNYRAEVRRKVFRPRDNLYLLFVLFDDMETLNIEQAWLVPSQDFERLTTGQRQERPRLVFAVNIRGTQNVWFPYRCTRRDLTDRIVKAIEELHGG